MTSEESPIAKRYRNLTGFWRWISIAFPIVGIIIAANYVFQFQLVGVARVDLSHHYLLLALLVAPAFLYYPLKTGVKGIWARRFFRLDVFLFFLCLGITLFLSSRGFNIIFQGWSEVAPPYAAVMAIILWALLLEALRRSIGLILVVAVFLFSLYPIVSEYMPGLLEGIGRPFVKTITYHMLGVDSAMGVLMRVFAETVLGFIVFGVTVLATGGGQFFLNLAMSLVGRTRGGPAKVAVMASAMFGSMSGSVIANVVTTGSVTIPAIKKTGYPSHYAGAIEMCASTGGALAPPIMGTAAFILASFVGISYAFVALAAAIPTVLYFSGLFVQVDAFAAKKGLRGLSKSESPSFIATLRGGWYYLPTALVLIYILFILRRVSDAPFIATLALLVLSQIGKNSRFTVKSFIQYIQQLGRSLADLCCILCTVGMLLGTFSITGIALTFARELVMLAGGNIIFMLILGAVASFILGMGMTTTACYVFLAIVLAPALVMAGLNMLAVHLFVLYCGIMSYIIPPVATSSFPAGIISEAPPVKCAITACRLGGVIFVLPFFFVLDPSLVLQGEPWAIVHAFSTALLGVFLISSAFEGYMSGIGKLWPGRVYGYLLRAGLIVSGILLGLPGWQMDGAGLAIAFVILSPMLLRLVLRFRIQETLNRPSS